jgi:phage antirepressor YoqD-like protein
MAKQVDQLPVTIERLERALVLLAYFIELDGDVHLPMYERFEAELAELKTKEAAKHRARKRLESYLNEGGGLKAIR